MNTTWRAEKFDAVLPIVSQAYSEFSDPAKITIENFVGFVKVPVKLAGPLRVHDAEQTDDNDDGFFAPLATVEPTLVASCSRGCKALNACGGVQFRALDEGMSRAPVFCFARPEHAVAFAGHVPSLTKQFAADAESTSQHARLKKLTPHIIGSKVHVKFDYACGDAAGQNMVTIATQEACDRFLETDLAKELGVKDFVIEGDMASDKKASWGNVKEPRGVQVLAWGELSNQVCEDILGCSTERLSTVLTWMKEGQARNGQLGSNVNTANVVAAMFIACGQDAGSVAEASWSHLTSEYDGETKILRLSLFFPSLPVGVVGGGTKYSAQKASLELLKCRGPGGKRRLAGLMVAFALALDASTAAAIASGTFTQSHKRLARGMVDAPKL
ncbi:hydroxymethylglutaryl-CoA reductase [Corynespora cassiicola Philippines]|uniref:hydroxymethylglutaryl-CoA reductase (NADPH) n=1 Tax=Corynespora cassiicola Philippines TaxID=1448308 RepID=A0A2T2N1V2_CORCC|nr:hydroxymethylglutaryl-CoA reductase [Corynespora cassiicola Philippines]